METSTPRLARNKRGIYEIRYSERQPDGRWRSRSVSTRATGLAEAKTALAGFLVAEQQATAAAGVQFQTLVEQYLRHGRTRGITKSVEYALRPVSRFFGTMTPAQITPQAQLDYRAERMAGQHGKGHKPAQESTLRRELGALKTVLAWAAKHQIIPRDTVPNIDLPPLSQPRDVWLDEPQTEEFLKLAAGTTPKFHRLSRIHRFVWIALWTGARRHAIETLTWDRVDLVNRLIDFRVPGARLTKKRRAVVPIADQLLPVLVRASAERFSLYVLDDAKDIAREFQALVKGTKFAHLIPHDLRRTCATLMARAGVDLWAIAGVLGDHPSTVVRTYAHHSPGNYLRTAVNRGATAAQVAAQSPLVRKTGADFGGQHMAVDAAKYLGGPGNAVLAVLAGLDTAV
jgi:integrase